MDQLFDILGNVARAGVGVDAVIYALAAIGLNVQFGYAGLLNFGQSAFMAMGAYGIGIGVASLGLPLGVAVLIGLGATIVLAVVLGIPTLRLRADYLAIATIAAAEIVRLAARSNTFRPFTGGSGGISDYADGFYGLNPFPNGTYGFGPWRFSERVSWVLLVGWTLVALAALVVFLLMRSPWGRVVKGIREDEDAVRSLGKNVYAYKIQALVIGGVIGCLAGFVFAVGRSSVQPDNYSTATTFFIYTVLLLGGAARVLGPVLGAAVFWMALSLTDSTLRELIENDVPIGLSGVQVGQVRFVLVGAVLMLLMIFRPQGILGDKREIAINAR